MNTKKFVWVELIKAFALVWIFFNHTAELLFGYPLIANPTFDWPPLAERVTQLRPLTDIGFWTIPANLLRYIGWSGDQGVHLFIIVSGFGLTWGLLNRQADRPLSIGQFYLRRAERIFPLWWGAHLLFAIIWLLTGWGLSLTDPATYLSALGIRITPGLFYYFSPAWWYVWLVIQLYLVYPLLWEGLRRLGPTKMLIFGSFLAFIVRGAGLYFFDGYLDVWQRGAIFITRLPEFLFGISLAAWLYYSPEKTNQRLNASYTLLIALVVYIFGFVLGLTLPGIIIAPFLLGVGAFLFLYGLLERLIPILPRWLLSPGLWTGRHTYSLYLMHHPVILVLIPFGALLSVQVVARIILAVVLTVLLAVGLEWSVNGVVKIIRGQLQSVGASWTAVRVCSLGVLLVIVLVGTELFVRWYAPQEVLGWGERPSLEVDPEFGWKLNPSKETHLRWESYDYWLQANELGFPGALYPEQRDTGTIRVMVTGDAFTSAEGVDTEQAWPRLLEDYLGEQYSDHRIEVLNFAITGYGPNQYAAVIEAYAPIYNPDLIILGFFVNDYQDVLWSNEQFQQSIGFDLPPQNNLLSVLRLQHLQRLVRLQVIEPGLELLRRQPRPHGYFLGNFAAFEVAREDITVDGKQAVIEQLTRIREVAETVNADVLILMIPAPIQVCQPGDLAYYPNYVNLQDTERYDLALPQRMTKEISTQLGFLYYDAQLALDSDGSDCFYQEHNMHWTSTGHQVVTRYLVEKLFNDQVIE